MSLPGPNFFIVGAPKCGTSAMAAYLSEHPRIFMSTPKEPHYFATDLDDPVIHHPGATWEWYQSLFAGAGDAERVGEASVFYLYSRVAIERLLDVYPDAKLLVMLRNPIDLVYSLHSQLLYSGQESIADFEVAWQQQEGRGGSPLLKYGSVGRLGEQVQRLLRTVDRAQVCFVVFEDFVGNPGSEYARVLEFLEVAHDGRNSFPIVNPNRSHRSVVLKRVIDLIPDPGPLKRALGIHEIGLVRWLNRRNLRRHTRQPLTLEFRAELRDYFADDVRRLGTVLGRSFASWTEALPRSPGRDEQPSKAY